MAKVPFSKLDIKINSCDFVMCHENSKGEVIQYEVKNYLSIKEKMDLVSRIINQSTDDNGFYNPMRVKLYTTLEVVYAYTNLTFTPKQKEDPFKLYDLLVGNGFAAVVIKAIPEPEYDEILTGIKQTIKSVYKYQNSILGILDTISQDYSNLNLDASAIHQQLADPENMALLKNIMTKLG